MNARTSARVRATVVDAPASASFRSSESWLGEVRPIALLSSIAKKRPRAQPTMSGMPRR